MEFSTAIIIILSFTAGLVCGFVGAIKAVGYGIRAAFEARNGDTGLTGTPETGEIDMLNEAEKESQ